MTTLKATPLDQQKLHACSVRVRSPAMIRNDYFFDKGKILQSMKKKEQFSNAGIYRFIFMILATIGNILYICRRLILVCSILLRITSPKKNLFFVLETQLRGVLPFRPTPLLAGHTHTSWSCIKSTTCSNLHG